MTGALYANLPYGPQLNNYNDLLGKIKNADTSKANELIAPELNIIDRISKTFPEDRMVFDAAHKEPAWLKTNTGELILYTWTDKLVAKIN